MVKLDFLRNEFTEVRSMTHSLLRVLLVSLVAVGLFTFCASSSRAQSAGETLFKSKCAACHGLDGKGEVPMGKKLGARNLASTEVQSQSDAQLVEVVTKGKNKMPSYDGKLKSDEIKGLVAYIRELAKKSS
jgi:mono/diheme cytochrome c family protein